MPEILIHRSGNIFSAVCKCLHINLLILPNYESRFTHRNFYQSIEMFSGKTQRNVTNSSCKEVDFIPVHRCHSPQPFLPPVPAIIPSVLAVHKTSKTPPLPSFSLPLPPPLPSSPSPLPSLPPPLSSSPPLPSSPLSQILPSSLLLSSTAPAHPSQPPLPTYSPPAQPPLPDSPSPPAPSALPSPANHLLSKCVRSPNKGKFDHPPVFGGQSLLIFPKSPFQRISYASNPRIISNSFHLDRRPSKIYIDINAKPIRSRQASIQNRCVTSPLSTTVNKRAVNDPTKNQIPPVTYGPIRSHYFNKKSKKDSPELITLSDSEEEIVCLQKRPISTSETAAKDKPVVAIATTSTDKNVSACLPTTLDDPISISAAVATDVPLGGSTVTSKDTYNKAVKIKDSPLIDASVVSIPLPTSSNASSLSGDYLRHTTTLSPVDTVLQPTFSSKNSTNSVHSEVEHVTLIQESYSACSLQENIKLQPEQYSPRHECSMESEEQCLERRKSIMSDDEQCDGKDTVVSEKQQFVSGLDSNFKYFSNPYRRDAVINGLDSIDADYVPLQRARLSDVVNQDIDICDETLEWRQQLDNLRRWEPTGFARDYHGNKRSNDALFTLISYNVLGQQLLDDNMFLYKECEPEHLAWRYRWALLQHEIKKLDADILTLQEVQSNHYHEFYLPWFTHLHYKGVYKKRTNTKSDGCAIFFRKDKFKLIESVSVEYRQPNTFLDRDNVGLVCMLSSLENNARVCVATTHLLFNPKRHDIKMAQLQMFLTEIERISHIKTSAAGYADYTPIIITGDMNALPQSTIIRFLKDSFFEYYGCSSKSLTQYGPGQPLVQQLLPPQLGITDTCQHAGVLLLRQLHGNNGSVSLQSKRSLEESKVYLHHSERSGKLPQQLPQESWSFTGNLQHPFLLRSVFKHTLDRLGGAPEITAQANNWQTVDYMLYSQIHSRTLRRPVEGSLKLLARYGLLSGPEAQMFGPVPSAVVPSDHFPLGAKFLLRPWRQHEDGGR